MGSLRLEGGGAISRIALTLASGSHLQTLHPSLTWEGRFCLRPGSRKVPSLRCPLKGSWGRVGRA